MNPGLGQSTSAKQKKTDLKRSDEIFSKHSMLEKNS